MEKLNVAVLFGGCSAEHAVSKISAAAVIANLSKEKYNVMPIYMTTDGKWLFYDGCIERLDQVEFEKFGVCAVLSPDRTERCLLRLVGGKARQIPIDVVFPVLHGVNGEDGTVQGLLELTGIPYVGCGVLASALCMDKAVTKQLVQAFEVVAQTPYFVLRKSDLDDMGDAVKKIRAKIGYPCFVKPANTGSSVGISKAKNKKELEAALLLAARFDDKMIVEKAVVGRELECAVLGTGGDDTQASVIGEIIPAAEFYDYDAKYNNAASETLVPADIPPDISEAIREAALTLFKKLDCRGLARVDFFLEAKTNRVLFNEINTMPGFTSISMYPMLWREMGMELPALLDHLIDIALERVRILAL